MTEVASRHRIEKVRNETRRRLLTVSSCEHLTPKMLRITFASPDLHDFASRGPDDHIKLFITDPTSPKGVSARDYTPRSFDPAGGTLAVDFALHEGGAATTWAIHAKPGDTLEIGGPRGSMIVHDTFDHYLLVGDETALPSIARRLEGLRAGVPVTTVVVVDGPQEIQKVATAADWTPVWAFREGQQQDDAALLKSCLESWKPGTGDGYVWIAGEARTARQLRDYMLDTRQHPKVWLKATGYWVRGVAGESDKLD